MSFCPIIERVLNELFNEITARIKDNLKARKKLKSLESEIRTNIGSVLEKEKDKQYYNELSLLISDSTILSDYLARALNGEERLDITQRVNDWALNRNYNRNQIVYFCSVFQKLSKCIDSCLLDSLDNSDKLLKYMLSNDFNDLCGEVRGLRSDLAQKRNDLGTIFISKVFGHELPDLGDLPLLNRNIIIAESEGTEDSKNVKSAIYFVLEYGRILLSGDAGCGKTFALYQLNSEAELLGIHTIFYSLPDIPKTNVLNDLADGKITLNQKTLLLLDSLDELVEIRRGQLIDTISEIVRRYPDLLIVVSTRGTVPCESLKNSDFKECRLSPLRQNDINDYIIRCGIDSNEFVRQINDKSLNDLYTIPFYLRALITIWNQYGKLPVKSDLMRQLLQTRICSDSNRHSQSRYALQDEVMTVTKKFERIALIMQCVHRQTITSGEMDRIINSDKLDLEFYGLWENRNDQGWRFAHSLFREYFAACALSRMEFNEILSFIVNPVDKKTVKPSWYNVLAFLLSELDQSNASKFEKLLEWLVDNDVNSLFYCEKDKVKESVRTNAFKCLLDDCKKKNNWIDHSLFFDGRFSDFACTVESIGFILQELELSSTIRQKHNLLKCLESFSQWYQYKDDVVSTIRDYVFDPTTDIRIKAIAVDVMANHYDMFMDISYPLTEVFRSTDDRHLRYHILRFWQVSNQYEDFFEFVLAEYDRLSKRSDEYFTYIRFLSDLITNITKMHSVELVLDYIVSKQERLFDFRNASIITKCCEIATQAFRSGQQETILSYLLHILVHNFALSNEDYESIRQYMICTNSEETVYNFIMSNGQSIRIPLLLGLMMCDSILERIERESKNGGFETVMLKEMAYDLSISPKYRNRIAQIYFFCTGNRITIDPFSSFDEKRRAGYQKYCNALFDKDAYGELINRIIEILGEKATIRMDVNSQNFDAFSKMNNETELHNCWFDINHLAREDEDIMLINCLERIKNWESFRLHCLNRLLENRSSEIIVSDIQRKQIEEFVHSVLGTIDFGRIVVKDNNLTYPAILPDCLRAMRLLNLRCSEELAIRLLSVPLVLFDDRDSFDKYPDWLVNSLDRSVMSSEIIKRINNRELNVFLTPAYLRYCIDNKVSECKAAVIEFVLDPEYNCGYYSYGVEYISTVFGEKILINEVVPFCTDMKVLLDVSKSIPANALSAELDEKLWAHYCATKDMDCLCRLIKREYSKAVEEYYHLALSLMALPDDVPEPAVPILSDSLSSVSSPGCTETMIKLFILAYNKDFKDRKDFGLKYFSFSALRRIAVNNADNVIEKLEQQKRQETEEITEAITNLQQTIQDDQIRSSDIPWTFEEALTLVPET